jgi:hypothetical protein
MPNIFVINDRVIGKTNTNSDVICIVTESISEQNMTFYQFHDDYGCVSTAANPAMRKNNVPPRLLADYNVK